VKNELRLAEMWISKYFNRKTLNTKQYGCNFQMLEKLKGDSKILLAAIFFITVKPEALVS